MLSFNKLHFSDSQCERAGKIIDRVVVKREGRDEAMFNGVPKMAHWLEAEVPSSNGGKYRVYVGGYDGRVQAVHCHCAAGQDDVVCYHVKAVLEYLKKRAVLDREQQAARDRRCYDCCILETCQKAPVGTGIVPDCLKLSPDEEAGEDDIISDPDLVDINSIASFHDDYTVWYCCTSEVEVEAIFRSYDPRGYATAEIKLEDLPKKMQAGIDPDKVYIVRRSRSSD